MSEIAKKKDSLKSKKHTFLLIVKISVITINIFLWIGIMFFSGVFFEDKEAFFAVTFIIDYFIPIFLIVLFLLLIPIYYLYMSFIYIF